MPDAPTPIVLAGGTGDLGLRIAAALRERGALVVALVRADAPPAKTQPLRKLGVTLALADFTDAGALAVACAGAGCVVSALSGLRETIVGAQGALLEAAVRAGVPRFIPSDYSIDFRPLPPGSNRNFDLRRDFHARLDAAPIRATSIFNGAFADLLAGQAPIVLFGLHRVLYWESADQPLDFTTKNDVAAFTAEAALDPMAPRALHVAGTRTSARGLAEVMSRLGDRPYKLLRAGGLGRLAAFIRIARAIAPGKGQVFPPWQGMQYLHNMFDPTLPLWPLDNGRYETPRRWTGVEEVLREAVLRKAPARA